MLRFFVNDKQVSILKASIQCGSTVKLIQLISQVKKNASAEITFRINGKNFTICR